MSDVQAIQAELIYPAGILSFPSLNPEKPRMNDLSGKHEWSATVLWSPTNKYYLAFRAEYDALREEFVKRYRKEPKTEPQFKIIDEWANADRTKKSHPLTVGMIKMKMSQNMEGRDREFPAPQLLRADGSPASYQDFYPGCVVRGFVNIREYNNANDKGISISRGISADLRAVQFVRDGDTLGAPQRDYAAHLAEAHDDEIDAAAAAAAYPI